ncbi:FdtA/QdtA family cupin domain-containing protein [Flavivirga abyssicola]|uniref:sugar 3,4-ketoisomerase n=1 Tax=Flavivirga abyssicola TaxID=3063533 RepID=UPI0026E020B9|nr:FdtA/QdtA family cupin domain-containing protein [Flavivirga sp. MEBiC07777]WVK12044.1 FdtA/QdtA family cupin domain-containing protein [Flavivirga sp. MEBiC07777]
MTKQNMGSGILINIPKIIDENGRGNLAVIEKDIIPFKIERVYYLFDVPSGSYRGGHAHKRLSQFLVALAGSFDVVLKDNKNTKRITLNNPTRGLLITPGTWRELENFSSGAVCLVLASDVFDEDDYIRNYDEFVLFKGR